MAAEAVAAGQLRAFVERVERLEEEKRGISDDIKEVFAEAEGNGFDTKVMRHIIRLRRMDQNKRQSHMALLDLYLAALGMVPQPVEADGEDGEADVEAADEAAKKKRRRRKEPELPLADGPGAGGGDGKVVPIRGKPKSDPIGFDVGDDS